MSPAAGPSRRVAALVLAAGRSQRMGANKLLANLDGRPLAAHAIDAALASQADPVLIVIGHEGEALRRALAGRAVVFVENPHHQQGLSASLRTGIAALPPTVEAALVCLADMPAIDAAVIDAVIAGFDPDSGAEIVAPVHDGRRGHPVLWGRRFFPELAAVTGDRGGKAILDAHHDSCRLVSVTNPGIDLDIDTPAALAAYRDATRHQD